MKNKDYWRKRFEILEQAGVNKGEAYRQILDRQYRIASDNIEKELSKWYSRFAVNNNITLTEAKRMLNTRELAEFKWDVKDYIKYGEENALNLQWMKQLENASARVHVSRLDALKLQMQQHIEVLYGNQVDGIDALARNIYSDGYYHTAFEIQHGFNIGWDLQPLNESQLDKILTTPWTTDKKTFGDRCWTNKQQLVGSVQTQLTQAIMRGDAPDKAIKAIKNQFAVSKHKAGRLVMTESAYFASVSQKDCFNNLDVERFEIVATLDLHTSEICQGLDGQVHDMKDYEPGVTAPPFHPWCRTTTVPYFEDNYSKRAARGANGKTYYVPDSIKYPDWKQTFVDGGSKGGLDIIDIDDIMNGQSESIKALKDTILKKHESILNQTHKTELQTILDDLGEDELNLYDKLSSNFSSSKYYGGKGHYLSFSSIVEMDMNSCAWEKRVGIPRTGAWQTKFHEEFHQLDDILHKTKFGFDDSGKKALSFGRAFTNPATTIGEKMIEAIDQDVLTVVNEAIDWMNDSNKKLGITTKIKHLKSLDRISSDAYKSTISYLKFKYPTEKDRAQIYMFTDAMGLTTNNRLNPHGNGFWGHDASYNKDRGKRGATSETWATYGSTRLQKHEETDKILRGLMPNTFKVYDGVYDEVLEYAKSNNIEYIK